MYSLPVHNNSSVFPQLNAWFQYKASQHDGFNRIHQFLQQQFAASETSTRTQLNYQPLTPSEEQRWKILERKATQENLAGYDSAEYEILLEVKLYQRLKTEELHLSHEQIIEIVRQSL